MKPLALAFLIIALTPALRAAAQSDPPSGTATDTTPAPADTKKDGGPPASTDLINGTPTKYGINPDKPLTPEQQKTVDERQGKVLDGNQQMSDFSTIAQKLSPSDRATAEVAMKNGLTPIVVNGQVMGYDDPINQVCVLPDAVNQQFASQIGQAANPNPNQNATDAAQTAAIGAQVAAAAAMGGPAGAIGAAAGAAAAAAAANPPPGAPGHVPKPGDPDFVGPVAPNQQPAQQQNPQANMANAAAMNDFTAYETAYNQDRDQVQTDAARDGAGGETPTSGPGTNAPTTPPGAPGAGFGPSSIGGGPGGHSLGADGQVGANGGTGGSRQFADARAAYEADQAFRKGLADGPPPGERDPNAHSVFETVTSFINGHGGHAFMQALGLNTDATHAVAETATGNDPNASGTNDGGSYHAGKGFDGAGEVRPTQQADHLCETSKPGAFCWNRTTSTPQGTPD